MFLQRKADRVVFKTLDVYKGKQVPCAVQKVQGDSTPIECRDIAAQQFQPDPLPDKIKNMKRWAQTKDLVTELLEDLVKTRDISNKTQWTAQEPKRFLHTGKLMHSLIQG